MGTKNNSGFTIIEVMLFLAVTGALAIGILVGSGVTIGQQRYRDSVNSLRSFIQTQYSEVTNVINDRDQDWTCTSTGAVTEVTNNGQPRGTSDCVVLGRLITIDASGTNVTASNVVGYRTPSAPTAASDVAEISDNYKLSTSPINQATTEVSWGAKVVAANTTNPQPVSILVIRSPLSGALLTFTMNGVQTNVQSMVTLQNMQQPMHLCVDSDGGALGIRRLEVRVNAFATSQAAIQIPTEGESVCG